MSLSVALALFFRPLQRTSQHSITSLLRTCLNHCSTFTFVGLSTHFSKSSISVNSRPFRRAINYTSQSALIISLSVLLKITISFSLRHHVLLPTSHISNKSHFPSNIMSYIHPPSSTSHISDESHFPSNIMSYIHPPLSTSHISDESHFLSNITSYIHPSSPNSYISDESQLLSNILSCIHPPLLTSNNSDKSINFQQKSFLYEATLTFSALHTTNSCSCCLHR